MGSKNRQNHRRNQENTAGTTIWRRPRRFYLRIPPSDLIQLQNKTKNHDVCGKNLWSAIVFKCFSICIHRFMNWSSGVATMRGNFEKKSWRSKKKQQILRAVSSLTAPASFWSAFFCLSSVQLQNYGRFVHPIKKSQGCSQNV